MSETGMEKLPDVFKAVVFVFHGIIATWLFLEFSERRIDPFYFMILLVFFTVANVFIWKVILIVAHRLQSTRIRRVLPSVTTLEVSYSPSDVLGLSLIAISIGLSAAYVDRKDVILELARTLTDWHRTSTVSPFIDMFESVSTRLTDRIDSRPLEKRADPKGVAYLRVYFRDSRIGYEGYPGVSPSRLETREAILSPACRFVTDENDPTKITSIQVVHGPGVYLRLAEVDAIEIVDYRESPCVKQQFIE
jgi:hypothetical protein